MAAEAAAGAQEVVHSRSCNIFLYPFLATCASEARPLDDLDPMIIFQAAPLDLRARARGDVLKEYKSTLHYVYAGR